MDRLHEVVGDADELSDQLPLQIQALVNRGVITEAQARAQWEKTKRELLSGSAKQNLYG